VVRLALFERTGATKLGLSWNARYGLFPKLFTFNLVPGLMRNVRITCMACRIVGIYVETEVEGFLLTRLIIATVGNEEQI
jgi:hypothetical protein